MTNKKKSNCGRPAGRIKTAKIEISIEPAVKDEFMTLLRNEGKTYNSITVIFYKQAPLF